MPVPLNDLQRVQKQCWNVDDDLRWIVAAISDTGCRMAEIVGLSKADVRLDGDIPSFQSGPGRGEGLKRPQVSGIYRWLDQLFGELLVPTNQRIQRCYFHATTMGFLLTPIVQALLYQNGSSSKLILNARCTALGIHSEIV
jgi:integrase